MPLSEHTKGTLIVLGGVAWFTPDSMSIKVRIHSAVNLTGPCAGHRHQSDRPRWAPVRLHAMLTVFRRLILRSWSTTRMGSQPFFGGPPSSTRW